MPPGNELALLIPPSVYRLLSLMFRRFRSWRPRIGYPGTSVGFASGGVVGIDSFEDMEEEADLYAVRVTETAFAELTVAERTAIEMVLGVQPAVWTVRPGVLEEAIRKLEEQMRRNGLC